MWPVFAAAAGGSRRYAAWKPPYPSRDGFADATLPSYADFRPLAPMRVLLIHNDDGGFAGAEKVLGYFLEGLAGRQCEAVLAAVRGSKLDEQTPPEIPRLHVSSSRPLSPFKLAGQLLGLHRAHRSTPFDLVHAWAAREWELAALTGALLRRPAVGTLHDHPMAPFLSPSRRKLMRGTARRALKRVICVSNAVRRACAEAGYPPAKLTVIHNGLPDSALRRRETGTVLRLGFLGVFSPRKGLRLLFDVLHELARAPMPPWECDIAGAAVDPLGEQLVAEIRARYERAPWWGQVRWLGWVDRPLKFLSGLDVLICPSSEFDPFPTVLLEAGLVGVPVLAADVGGVGEIVEHGRTGLLFPPGNAREAAARLQSLLLDRQALVQAGSEGRQRVRTEFSVERMVNAYLQLYADLARPGFSP
jgi:glycosyltransferase involved in cell wall biosynthesis